jgi:hypothetical protein
LAIINDILDFSKIEAGKLELESVPLCLPDLVQRACDTLAPAARTKGLALTVTLDPRVPEDLIGDPGRLRQVLLNLLGNALKFTERGQINIGVQWWGRAQWHRTRQTAADLRSILPGRRLDQPPLRRHRSGAQHHQPAGPVDGGPALARVDPGSGQYLPLYRGPGSGGRGQPRARDAGRT